MEPVKFSKDYDHQETRRRTVAYKAGWEGSVPKGHAAGARAAGALDEPAPAAPASETAKAADATATTDGAVTQAKGVKG